MSQNRHVSFSASRPKTPLFRRASTWWTVSGLVALLAVAALVATLALSAGSLGAASSTPTPTKTPTPTPTPTPEGFNKQALSIDDPNSLWVIVNKHRPLADPNYVPSPISDAPVPYAFASTLRTEAADALTTMFAAYTSETGGEMMLQSVYRSYETQAELYRGDDTLTARPGHSEHQTGLAADIGDISGQCAVQTCFAQMQAGQWLAANAWRFGFVLRYPDGFIEITGYEFEPWHYRFVGVELATEMHNTGTPTLEQFFGLDPAPRYLDQG